MHSRRFACFLLGLWLAGGVFAMWVTAENLRRVDHLLVQPSPAAAVWMKALGPGAARLLLRYEAAELNRAAIEIWEIAQLILGAGFFFFLLFGTSEDKFSLLLVLLALAVVLLQCFWLTPELTSLGRTLDFIPDVPSAAQNQFRVLDGAYSVMEVVKWVLLAVLTAKLVASRRGRSGDSRQEFDLVNKADHRHVNG